MSASSKISQPQIDAVATYQEQSLANLSFTLSWQSEGAKHVDCLGRQGVNAWRDMLPLQLEKTLIGLEPGATASSRFKAGELCAPYNPDLIKSVPRTAFDSTLIPHMHVAPDAGGFFPQGVIHKVGNLYGIYKQNQQPMRVLGRSEDHDNILVDLNHPFSSFEVELSAEIHELNLNDSEVGGRCKDWAETLTEGPGMQARYKNKPTDFFFDGAFFRVDESLDSDFYSKPRMVVHLDETALKMVRSFYAKVLKDGMKVLDLMSSMRSHIPEPVKPHRVTGLGLNKEELKANSQLSDFHVHDLNADPILPFESETFDACICTVSVEYLTNPVPVFEEVARVLKPGASFVLTFSHRWFPPMVIRVWQEIHPFERMGYVLECFHRSGRFNDLETWSMRGLPRPVDDPHYGTDQTSDPVFAVWGRRV